MSYSQAHGKEDYDCCGNKKNKPMALNSLKKNIGTPVADAILGNGKTGARQLLRDLLGFNARQVKTGGRIKGIKNNAITNRRRKPTKGTKGGKNIRGSNPGTFTMPGSSGGSVSTVNAPIAFARKHIAPGCKMTQLSANEVLLHNVDYVGPVTFNDLGTFFIGGIDFNPRNSFLSFTENEAKNYQKFKLKSATIHYAHYTSTVIPGKVMITFSPDVDAPDPVNTADMLSLNNCVTGACYEDFAYKVDMKTVDSDWKYMGLAGADNRLETCGTIFVATDNGTNSGGTNPYTTGDWFVESEWLFSVRELEVESSRTFRNIMKMKDPEQKKATLKGFFDKLIEEIDNPLPKVARQAVREYANRLNSKTVNQLSILALRGTKSAVSQQIGLKQNTLPLGGL